MRPTRKNIVALSTLPDVAYFLKGAGTQYKKLVNKGKRKTRRNSTDSSVRSPTSTSSDVRSPTRTRTATSTDAYTAGNITVTGGAGAGKTSVVIHQRKPNEDPKGGQHAPRNTSKSNRGNPAGDFSLQTAGLGGFGWTTIANYNTLAGAMKAGRERGQRFRIMNRHTGRVYVKKSRTVKKNTSKSYRVGTSRGNKGKVEKFYLRTNVGTRSNPDGTAAERYEYFHGRGPETNTDVKESRHVHRVLSGIGKLMMLEILAINGSRKVTLEGFKGALLAQDEKGKQLYIVGGDQSVNLKDFGITSPHELEILGALTCVIYFTTKDHLRPEDGGTAAYNHKFGNGARKYEFGKHGTRFPLIGYDVRNKLLSIQGGGYELPAEGIDG